MVTKPGERANTCQCCMTALRCPLSLYVGHQNTIWTSSRFESCLLPCPSHPLGGCSQQTHLKHPAFPRLPVSSAPRFSCSECCILHRISVRLFFWAAHMEESAPLSWRICSSSVCQLQSGSMFWFGALSIMHGPYGPHYSKLCLHLPSTPDGHEIKSISLICLCSY